MWSITGKEFRQFFSSLTAYIAIILFLLVSGLFLFVLTDSNILDFGFASLDRFFFLAPWIFIFLVPAVAMRSFAEEFKSGTFEILKTKPVSSLAITLGKYFAILLIILIILIPTLTYVYTISSLNDADNLDTGGILGSYIGLFLLASAFGAVSLCCGSFTSNAIVAFLISVFVNIALYFGFTALSTLPVFSGNLDYYIEMLGMDFHYQNLGRGVIDSRDVIYFFSIIFLALFITIQNIRKK